MALVEYLFDKGILERDEAREVLNRASHRVGLYSTSPGFMEAHQIIGDLLSGKLSQRVPGT